MPPSENDGRSSANEKVDPPVRTPPPVDGDDEPIPQRWLRVICLLAILVAAGSMAAVAMRAGLDNYTRGSTFYLILGVCVVLGVLLAGVARIGKSLPPKSKYSGGAPGSDQNKPWLELLKLEYEKGADRYENIYKAIWLNFSYSVAVGAAILTFAAAKLRLDLLQFLALSPVVFWFVATFIPMNYYGELTRARLRQIEADINAVFFGDSGLGFRHFTKFAAARAFWRVGDVVHLTGGLIGLYWIWQLASVLTVSHREKPLVLPAAPTVIRTTTAAAASLVPHAITARVHTRDDVTTCVLFSLSSRRRDEAA